jgi:CheY-like chemotaxis protein
MKGPSMLPRKILIIDDEKLIRLTTNILLKQHNIEALCAASGQEGISLAQQDKPDLILLDIMMPVMDGWEVLAALRGDPQTAPIPVVIFTAGDFAEAKIKARDAGAQGIIQKPFHLNGLLEVCQSAFKGENT